MTWFEVNMLVMQVFCIGESCYRGLWWKAMYWFGAVILTTAVIKGIK